MELIQVLGPHLGTAFVLGRQGLVVVLGVNDQGATRRTEADVCQHSGQLSEILRPIWDCGLGIPDQLFTLDGELCLLPPEEVADEQLEEASHLLLVSEKVPKAVPPARLVRHKATRHQLTHVE